MSDDELCEAIHTYLEEDTAVHSRALDSEADRRAFAERLAYVIRCACTADECGWAEDIFRVTGYRVATGEVE